MPLFTDQSDPKLEITKVDQPGVKALQVVLMFKTKAIRSSVFRWPNYRGRTFFNDITTHTFVYEDTHYAAQCEHSPSGYCHLYDEVKYTGKDVPSDTDEVFFDWIQGWNRVTNKIDDQMRQEIWDGVAWLHQGEPQPNP